MADGQIALLRSRRTTRDQAGADGNQNLSQNYCATLSRVLAVFSAGFPLVRNPHLLHVNCGSCALRTRPNAAHDVLR
jgi:hypothetical protein